MARPWRRGPVSVRRREKIVVLGMMSHHPVAGVIWQTVHYLVGLERLGYEAYYVEAHGNMPVKLMQSEHDDAAAKAAAFIEGIMRRFGLAGRWAFQARYEGGLYGMSERQLEELYGSAALLINLHGGTAPLPEHSASDRLIYLETDPVRLQIELHDDVPETVEFLAPHRAFFTFGENYGKPDCKLPVSKRFSFKPTRQPVLVDLWHDGGVAAGERFTTVASWRQARDVVFRGEVYSWSKHHEFLKFIELPRRTGQPFELALNRLDVAAERRLRRNGWRLRDALAISRRPGRYRDYIQRSRGEFTVAKDQNIRLRTGWFSDRSATYLAAGRPVITQETGFSANLPTGEGLFGFSSLAEAVQAVESINADYQRHSRAALAIAREYFSHDVVLRRLLAEAGV